MELLIIKNDNTYIRVKDDSFISVGLDKASVFPFDQMAKVKGLLSRIRKSGFENAAIYRLMMTEEPLTDEEIQACN